MVSMLIVVLLVIFGIVIGVIISKFINNKNSSEMVQCKACGKNISINANICPNCGLKNKKSITNIILICTCVLVVLYVLFAETLNLNFLHLPLPNFNDNNYDYDSEIVLSENDQKVYDTLIDYYLEKAYNPQSVRVISGNTLFGFKVSAENRVGGTVTNCISLAPGNYKELVECNSVYDDNNNEDWHIDVYKINQKLDQYWKNKGM